MNNTQKKSTNPTPTNAALRRNTRVNAIWLMNAATLALTVAGIVKSSTFDANAAANDYFWAGQGGNVRNNFGGTSGASGGASWWTGTDVAGTAGTGYASPDNSVTASSNPGSAANLYFGELTGTVVTSGTYTAGSSLFTTNILEQSGNQHVGQFIFKSGAAAYTINGAPSRVINVYSSTGGGITNNSTSAQTFNTIIRNQAAFGSAANSTSAASGTFTIAALGSGAINLAGTKASSYHINPYAFSYAQSIGLSGTVASSFATGGYSGTVASRYLTKNSVQTLAGSSNSKAGFITIGGTGTVNISGTIDDSIRTPSSTITAFAATTGVANLIIAGSSATSPNTVNLSGFNTYTGVTTIVNSTVNVLNPYAFGGNRALTDATAPGSDGTGTNGSAAVGTYTGFSSATQAYGAVTVSSGGAIDLNGVTMIGANALSLNGSGANSTGGALKNTNTTAATYVGAVALGSNSTITSGSGQITLSGGLSAGANTATFDGASATLISGALSGSGAITKSGAGTLTLSGNNTYTGSMAINSGNVDLTGATNAMTMTGGLTFGASSNSTLTIGGRNTGFGAITGDATATIQNNSATGATLTTTTTGTTAFSGIIKNGVAGGALSITKAGAGTLTLSGANNYTGLTTVSAGTLIMDTSAIGGTNASTYAGGISVAGGTVNFTNGTNAQTIAGNISGTGALIFGGTAAMTLSGDNSGWTGAGSWSAGTSAAGAALKAGSGSAFGKGTITVTGGNLDLNGQNMSGTAPTVLLGGTGLTTTGIINSSTSAATFSGTLKGNSGSTNTSVVYAQAGDINLTGSLTGGSTSGDRDISIKGSASAATNVNISGNITDNGGGVGKLSLLIYGSQSNTNIQTVTLSGTNTYTGGTRLDKGATLVIAAPTALSTSLLSTGTAVADSSILKLASHADGSTTPYTYGSSTSAATSVSIGGKLQLSTTDATVATNIYFGASSSRGSNAETKKLVVDQGVTATFNSTYDIITNTTAGNYQFAIDGAGDAIFNGAIRDYASAPSTNAYSAGLIKTGAGTVTLNGANTYTYRTTINGGTVKLGNTSALGVASAAVIIGSTGTLDLNGITLSTSNALSITNGSITNSSTQGATYNGAVTLTGTTALGGALAGDVTLASGIATGGNALTLSPSSKTLSVAGISGASLGNVTLASTGSGTIEVTGTVNYTGSLTNSGAGTNASTVSGNIGANVTSITQSGSNSSLYLSGNNSGFVGSVTVNNGTIRLASTNAVSSSNQLLSGTSTNDNSTLTLVGGAGSGDVNSYNMGGMNVGGKFVINKTGTGTAGITFTDGYLAGSATNRILEVGAGASVTVGDYNLFSKTSTSTNARNFIIQGAGDVTFTGAVTETNYAGTNAAGSNTYTAALIYSGAGTLTLTGTNTYTGGTTVSSGTLAGNAAGVRGNITNNSVVSINQGTSSSGSYSGVMSGTGSFTKTGNGTLSLSNTNTYSGETRVNAGKINLTGSIASSAVTISNGATLTATNSITESNAGASSANVASITANSGSQIDLLAGSLKATAMTISSGANGNAVINYTFGNTVALSGALTLTGSLNINLTSSLTGAGEYDVISFGSKSGAGSITLTGTASSEDWLVSGELLASTYRITVRAPFTEGQNASSGTVNVPLGGTVTDVSGTATVNLSNTGASISGTVTGGTINVNQNASIATLNGGNVVVAAGKKVTVSTGSSSGAISGEGALTKTGNGVLTLSGTNTFTGAAEVAEGTLEVTAASAINTAANIDLGASSSANAAKFKVNSATATEITTDINALSSDRTGAGNVIQNAGAGALTLSGNLDKNGTVLTLDGGSAGITVSGTITGAAAGTSDLVVTGGITTLTAQNTYSGPTYVNGGGTLVNGNASGALPTNTNLTLGSGTTSGTFDLNGNGQSVANLNTLGTGTANVVKNNGSSDATLTVSGGGSFAGVIQDGTTKKTALTVSGGTLNLNAENTLTGGISVTGGVLQAGNAAALGSNVVTVADGATLAAGNGTDALVANSQSLVLTDGSVLRVYIGSIGNNNTRIGTYGHYIYDQAAYKGENYSYFNTTTLDVSGVSAADNLGHGVTVELYNETGTISDWSYWKRYDFTFMTFGGYTGLGEGLSITELFNFDATNLYSADPTLASMGTLGINASMKYIDGSNTLTMSIPEPSTYGIGLGAFALAFAAIRRRQAKAKKVVA